jgi:putative transposase
MPRRARSIQGGRVYHVLNRANGRLPLFRKEADYGAFERVVEEAYEREPFRILAYCAIPNHWQWVVWPETDGQVSEFFRRLTATYTQRWHAHYHTSGTGHLYQGRFKSFPVETDEHLDAVLRYVERNPARAELVSRAEAWRWSSVWRFYHGDVAARRLLCTWPLPRPRDWLPRVNRAETQRELEGLRRSLQRGQPFGGEAWCEQIIRQLGLESTMRSPGRPKKLAAS